MQSQQIKTQRSSKKIFNLEECSYPELEMMKTDEDYSSNSSIKQRKGRVGRTCNGEYHYYVYQDFDFTANREHNPTEL
jgi:HrpA-like RNA helicase